jgi:hypothetical protein
MGSAIFEPVSAKPNHGHSNLPIPVKGSQEEAHFIIIFIQPSHPLLEEPFLVSSSHLCISQAFDFRGSVLSHSLNALLRRLDACCV